MHTPDQIPFPVTLEEVLAARDARAAFQQTLFKTYPDATLICLTVNIPGPIKRTPLSQRVFQGGVQALRDALAQDGMPMLFFQQRSEHTGSEAYFVVDADGLALKRLTCELEESLPYGRLLDADVHTKDGQISRTQVGYAPRGCMVCGQAGGGCASRRLHSLEALTKTFNRLAELAPQEEIS